MYTIEEYLDEHDHSAFAVWFEDLNAEAAAKVTVALTKLEQGLGDTKSVGEGVQELRIDFGPGYRVYFGKSEKTLIILLCGGTKRKQNRDIARAKRDWKAFKARKRKGAH